MWTREPTRREKVQALIEQGATEGEREAARAAMTRIEAEEAQHVAEPRREAEEWMAGLLGEAAAEGRRRSSGDPRP